MGSQESSRSARRQRTKPNTTVLHHCQACDAKWDNMSKQYSCPRCKYSAPRRPEKGTAVITAFRVNTDANGRIICHVLGD